MILDCFEFYEFSVGELVLLNRPPFNPWDYVDQSEKEQQHEW